MEGSVYLQVLCLLAALSAVHGQQDACEMEDGSQGLCKTVKECPEAGDLILSGGQPKICSFKDRAPIICCGHFPVRPPSRPQPKPIEGSTQRPSSKRPTYKTTYYFLTIFKTSAETSPMTSSTTPTTLPSSSGVVTTPSTTVSSKGGATTSTTQAASQVSRT